MRFLSPEINGVHLLPFHPSSSDGGFSVEDHAMVDPAVGTWDDVERLSTESRVMADAVINHVSSKGRWFRAHLDGDLDRADFFRVVPASTDMSAVVRPRPGPPTTTFTRSDGSTADYWTTFSADQVDLDFRSPEVLLAVSEAIIRYAANGATAIRLDAVAFIGKDPQTSSVHRPDTHRIVALLRDCLHEIDPGIVLITETNVPHRDNVAYLGTVERPEAHAIYQFTLAPLVLHALHTGDTEPLTQWASQLEQRAGTTVMNFLASHDGVGVRPAAGWLDPAQIAALADRCRLSGGVVNEAATPTGTEPYELAATWRSLCAVGEANDGLPFSDRVVAARIVAGHSVALALAGIPLLYVHSMAATENDVGRAEASGVSRDLNRTRFASPEHYRAALADDPVGGLVWPRLREMLGWRQRCDAFHPEAEQRLFPAPPGVVSIERRGDRDRAAVITNFSADSAQVEVGSGWREMGTGSRMESLVTVGAWETIWLEQAAESVLVSGA